MLKLECIDLVAVSKSREVGRAHTTIRRSGNRSCSVFRVGRNASSRVVPDGARDSRTSPCRLSTIQSKSSLASILDNLSMVGMGSLRAKLESKWLDVHTQSVFFHGGEGVVERFKVGDSRVGVCCSP